MLLNTEELLALVHGDAEPDRLVDLLDRLERCPESSEALQVMVALKANRAEALEVLHRAADQDKTREIIPHPSTRFPVATSGWSAGLRIAASVAIVTLLGAWAAYTFLGLGGLVDYSTLATKTHATIVGPAGFAADVDLASARDRTLPQAYEALKEDQFERALELLEDYPPDELGYVNLYRGTSYYFLEDYERALAELSAIEQLEAIEEEGVLQQASWYKANSLLMLNRPMQAIDVLEDVKSREGWPFSTEAGATYRTLFDTLGLKAPADYRD